MNGSTPSLLLHVSLHNTPEPTVSRMLSVPSQMSFMELHEAIAVAFGWIKEQCTSWVFRTVDREPAFVAFWTDQRYHHNTVLAIGPCMEKAGLGIYWTYDYNISKEQHAIRVIDTLTAGPSPRVTCLGGFGQIDRKLWQLASLIGSGQILQGGGGTWGLDLVALNVRLDEIRKKFEERKKGHVDLVAESKDNIRKRKLTSGSGSADADEEVVVSDGSGKRRKKDRVTRSGKVIYLDEDQE